MSKISKSLVTAIIAFALGAPAISMAGSDDVAGKAVKVSYADLNLQKAAGAEVLYRRLQNAAKQACDVRSIQVAGSLSNYAEMRTCYRESLDAAVAEVANEKVSSLHAG